jgi:hypothetical protein
MDKYVSIVAYENSTCELVKSPLWSGIWQASHGKPCIGCLVSPCMAKHQLGVVGDQLKPTMAARAGLETVRQEAERLGVSISEIRRQRRAS